MAVYAIAYHIFKTILFGSDLNKSELHLLLWKQVYCSGFQWSVMSLYCQRITGHCHLKCIFSSYH